MSFNRATQQPCSPTCCSPATFAFLPPPQYPSIFGTQANASKIYNINALYGLQSDSVDVNVSAIACIPTEGAHGTGECCPQEGWDATFEYIETNGGGSGCGFAEYEISCSTTFDCPDSCAGIAPCGDQEHQYECFTCAELADGSDECDGTGVGAQML